MCLAAVVASGITHYIYHPRIVILILCVSDEPLYDRRSKDQPSGLQQTDIPFRFKPSKTVANFHPLPSPLLPSDPHKELFAGPSVEKGRHSLASPLIPNSPFPRKETRRGELWGVGTDTWKDRPPGSCTTGQRNVVL